MYLIDAFLSSVSVSSHVKKFCAFIIHRYFNPQPKFSCFDDVEGRVCSITLPCNAPIHEIISSPQSSTESAKKDACLKACKELHKLGALTDCLLHDQDDRDEELELNFTDSEGCEG